MIAPCDESDIVVERGKEIYDRIVRPHVTEDQVGQFVAIDTVTGDYEISPDDVQAVLKLCERVTPGRFYFVRIGHSTPYRIGASNIRVAP